MPETITRQERLDAIMSLMPPRRVVDGEPQPYNSKIYNTVSDLIEMIEADMVVIHGLNQRCASMRTLVEGNGKFPRLPSIPKPKKLTVDERAHTLLNLAWAICVNCGHAELAKAIQAYLNAPPEVVQENLVT